MHPFVCNYLPHWMEVETMPSFLKRIGLPALGLVVFAACAPADDTELDETDEAAEMTPPMETTTPEPVDPAPYTAMVSPASPDGTVSGNVEIDPNLDGTAISVQFTGLTPGEHAWHIHQGTCATPGDVVVPFTDTESMMGIGEPLTADEEGNASAEVTVPAASLATDAIETGDYSLHVHERGGTDSGASVACSDLRR
jgi:Cu/Zn superoxide dismutase